MFKWLFFSFALSYFASTGSYVFPDGSRYTGEWDGHKRHGIGKQVWQNGAYYDGSWVNDKKHGYGLFVLGNGEYYQGIWVNNWPGNYLENPNIFSIHNLDEMRARFPQVSLTMNGLILESMDDYNDAFGAKNYESYLLSKGLALRGIDAKIVHYSSAADLKRKIQQHSTKKLDFVWLRAHGTNHGLTFNCGHDVGTAELLASAIAGRLSENAVIILDSCDTGVPNGLAEQLMNLLCQYGMNLRIIAPDGEIAYSGFDVATYEITVLMITITGRNIAKTFYCYAGRSPTDPL